LSDTVSAVDATTDGNVIKVAAGVYTDVHTWDSVMQAVYVTKGVAIRGGYTPSDWTVSDPVAHATRLDAGGLGRVIYITGSISPTIEGLLITGGDATGLGGGAWDYNGTGAIIGEGGGIAVAASDDALLYDNIIRDNLAASGGRRLGGGLYIEASDTLLRNHTAPASSMGAVLLNNIVRGNSASSTTWDALPAMPLS
jgi:hypothetical protein